MLRHATPAMTNVAGAIVPEREHELYLVCGIAEGIGQMLARQMAIALPAGPLELTLLPYRGRYFYDGIVAGHMRSLAGDSGLMKDAQTLARDLEAAGKLCSGSFFAHLFTHLPLFFCSPFADLRSCLLTFFRRPAAPKRRADRTVGAAGAAGAVRGGGGRGR